MQELSTDANAAANKANDAQRGKPKIKKQDQDFDNFKLKAKLRLANNIYNVYDLSLNRKYDVEINNKTLNRIKNSF